MSGLRIVSAKPDDLERYINIHEDIRDWLGARGLTPLERGIHPASADYYGQSIAKREVYFACIGDETVGSFRLTDEDPIVWPEAPPDALYLHSLIVLRVWSGRGFGREMLAWCEAQVQPAAKAFLRLDCFASNAFLRRYYETAGYADRGEIDAQYPFGTLRLQRYEKLKSDHTGAEALVRRGP